tara:strand:+ start:3030 stop:3944 length:915 start_codon:yes stop_codon:yes gene_type:complete
MSSELANIIQNNPGLAQTGLDADTLAVAGGINTGSKRISIKGGVFRKYAGGKEVGTIEDRHMNVIIVKMAHTANRMFYAQQYQEGVSVSPTCWSTDSRVPDADVETPQAKSCDQCTYSVRNSAAGNGSSCRLSWRVAVVLPNDPSGDILQVTLPSTSCWQKEDSGKWGFRPYVQMLANNNVSASRVITKIQFDSKAATPKLLFSPVGAVPPDDVPIIDKQAKSSVAEQATKLSVYKPAEDVAAPAQPTAATPTQEILPGVSSPIVAETSPDVSEDQPKIKEAAKAPIEKPTDVNDIVKKWSVKD